MSITERKVKFMVLIIIFAFLIGILVGWEWRARF